MGLPITELDRFGVVADRKPYTLPPGAWSDGRNMRFIEGSVYPTLGHAIVAGTPTVSPYYLHMTLDLNLTPVFAYAGLAQIYATDGTTHTNITRAVGGNYTGTINDLWQASEFGGISVFNNGVDVPQVWNNRQLSQQLVDMANWPSTLRAKIIRPFRRFLFAFDVSKSGTRYPQLVKWSHEADPGSVPSTWDETDETKDAGEYPLIDTGGPVLDALALGDVFCIYKSDAMYLARYRGGTFVFDLPLQFRDFGILSQRAVGEWQKKHVVLSNDSNVFIHDAFKYEPVIEGRMRRWLASRIDQTNAFRSFLVINHAENEAWVCFPESGAQFCTTRLIVNLKTGSAVPCDLPEAIAHIEYNKGLGQGGTTFDAQTTPFDSMVGYFGQTPGTTSKKVMVGCSPSWTGHATGSIFLYDSGYTFAGTAFTAYIERLALSVNGKNFDGSLRMDPSIKSLFQQIWPKLEMQVGTGIQVRGGGSETSDGAVTWGATQTFTPGTDLFVEVNREVRYPAVRFECSNSEFWRLTEYDVEIANIGKLG
jgi:hypothetical protein